ALAGYEYTCIPPAPTNTSTPAVATPLGTPCSGANMVVHAGTPVIRSMRMATPVAYGGSAAGSDPTTTGSWPPTVARSAASPVCWNVHVGSPVAPDNLTTASSCEAT